MNRLPSSLGPSASFLTIPSPGQEHAQSQSAAASSSSLVPDSAGIKGIPRRPSYLSMAAKFFKQPLQSNIRHADAEASHEALDTMAKTEARTADTMPAYQRLFDDEFLSMNVDIGLGGDRKGKGKKPEDIPVATGDVVRRLNELSNFQHVSYKIAVLFVRGLMPAQAELAARVCTSKGNGLIGMCQRSEEGPAKTAKLIAKMIEETPALDFEGTDEEFYVLRTEHYEKRLRATSLNDRVAGLAAKIMGLGQLVAARDIEELKAVPARLSSNEKAEQKAKRKKTQPQIERAVVLQKKHESLINDIWSRSRELINAQANRNLTQGLLDKSAELRGPLSSVAAELEELVALSETLFGDRMNVLIESGPSKRHSPTEYRGSYQATFKKQTAERARQIEQLRAKADPTRHSIEDQHGQMAADSDDDGSSSEIGEITSVREMFGNALTRNSLVRASLEIGAHLDGLGDETSAQRLQRVIEQLPEEVRQSIERADTALRSTAAKAPAPSQLGNEEK